MASTQESQFRNPGATFNKLQNELRKEEVYTTGYECTTNPKTMKKDSSFDAVEEKQPCGS